MSSSLNRTKEDPSCIEKSNTRHSGPYNTALAEKYYMIGALRSVVCFLLHGTPVSKPMNIALTHTVVTTYYATAL